MNIEADSINAALLAPDAAGGGAAFDAFVREVVREMTVKAGQKCTAIRRIFVPADKADAVAEALAAKLEEHQGRRSAPRGHAHGSAGDARASRRRRSTASASSRAKRTFVCGGAEPPALDGIDRDKSAFVAPTLLKVKDADDARGGARGRGVRAGGDGRALPRREQTPARWSRAAAARWWRRSMARTRASLRGW